MKSTIRIALSVGCLLIGCASAQTPPAAAAAYFGLADTTSFDANLTLVRGSLDDLLGSAK